MTSPAAPNRALLACALAHGVGGGLGWSSLPPLLPQAAGELGLSHGMGGVVWGAASLGIALAAPVGGALVDRLGPRRVAGAALVLGALACVARALAVGPWSLAVAMLAFGIHVGLCSPAIPKLLASHLPPQRVARANGLALLAYTLGTAGMLIAAAPLASAVGGWRPLTLLIAGCLGLAAVGWVLLSRDRQTAAPGHGAPLRDFAALARHRGLRLVAVMHFLLFGSYLAALGVLPRALMEGGMPASRVGTALAAWLCAAAIANALGPWLSDRLGTRRLFFVVGPTIAALALGALALAPSHLGLLLVAAVGGGAVAPLLLSLPLELPGVGPARIGAALGLLVLVGQLGGAVLPVAAGALAPYGMSAPLGLLALLHLAIVVPALRLGEPRTSDQRTTVATTRPDPAMMV